MMMADPNLFIYRAAHDLRAPLMSVRGLIHIMRIDKEPQNLDHYFNLMEQSVDRMNRSIDAILDFSKNERVRIISQPVDFEKIAKDVMESLRYFAQAQSTRMDFSVQQKDVFYSDHTLLTSIITNLLSNAIQYRDTIKLPFVSLRITASGQGAQLCIKDNGIGIEENLCDKIFTKFFRASHDSQGSGLGLFIVKNSVENLGGTIQVQSTPGQGTAFTVQIPNGIT
jgi:signal transduction histidine kinase